jgi:predicted PurR-regulated permease PerM
MIIELIISNFEVIIFVSIIFVLIGIILLFFIQNNEISNNKKIILNYINALNNSNKEFKDYLISIGKMLDQQKNEISLQIERISSLEREINRLSNVKGSEDMLGLAIEMARSGENRDNIKNKTGLRDDEIEAIYTYYRK